VNLGGTLGLRGYPEYGYIVGSRAWMVNQELRFPILRHLTLGTPAGDLPFPGIQGALFFDVGKATFEHVGPRATLGSYGVSFRMALAPLAVIRLDWGRRFSSGNNSFEGYSLTDNDKRRTFVHFFFGYNY
jgi:hemolysin activation/secretion protein